MSLEAKINADIKEAMKAKDQIKLRGIRAIKSSIMLLKTDGSGKEIDEATEIKLLTKLIKQRKDSLEIFEKQNREDLAVKEREEIEVISKYLPVQLSIEELEQKIKEIVEQTGASSMKDMGKVMGMASQKFAGKADGKTISGIVKNLLSQIMNQEGSDVTEKMLLIKEQLSLYTGLANEVIAKIKEQDISNYPIFIAHQDEASIGIPIITRKESKDIWSINISTLEEFYTKKMIAEEKLEDFKNLYNNHKFDICFFVISELGAQFIFFPNQKINVKFNYTIRNLNAT